MVRGENMEKAALGGVVSESVGGGAWLLSDLVVVLMGFGYRRHPSCC